MSRKIIYYSILSALSLTAVYLLYMVIGYIVLGSRAPVLYNGTYAYFMGMYLMAITFFVIFLLVLTIIIILIVKRKKILNKFPANPNE